MSTRVRQCLLALPLGAVALALAGQHPLWPIAAASFVLLMGIVTAWRADVGIVLFAALLPVVDQSIHTGPWLGDELDLMVLGVLAGGVVRLGLTGSASNEPAAGRLCAPFLALSAGVALAGLPGLWWALPDSTAGWPDAVATVWRASKPFVWAMLLLPLWLALCGRRAEVLARHWAFGCAIGLALVCGVVLWELALETGRPLASPGYRTAGWFWEMRLGGGAIDVYLTVTVPLALGALLVARSRVVWWAMALVLTLALQVLVSTQSRALMVAVAAAVLVVAWSWRHRRGAAQPPVVGAVAWGCLASLVGLQLLWGLAAGSGLPHRMGTAVGDLGYRVSHWQRVLQTLPDGHGFWTGVGAGQLPERYGRVAGPGEFPGSLGWVAAAGAGEHMLLGGPVSDARIGHLFAAGQRLHRLQPGPHKVQIRLAATQASRLLISVCERHLIYDRRCQWNRLAVPPARNGEAIGLEVALRGDGLERDGLLARWRPAWFAVSVLTPGATVRIEEVALVDAAGQQRLHNNDFEDGATRWLAIAQGRFEPWHADNLYLEFLAERGVGGLLGLLGLVFLALRAGHDAHGRTPWATGYLASTVAVALLGTLISAAEMPRLALLVWVTLGATTLLKPNTSHKDMM